MEGHGWGRGTGRGMGGEVHSDGDGCEEAHGREHQGNRVCQRLPHTLDLSMHPCHAFGVRSLVFGF
jgi:hypothetical protein